MVICTARAEIFAVEIWAVDDPPPKTSSSYPPPSGVWQESLSGSSQSVHNIRNVDPLVHNFFEEAMGCIQMFHHSPRYSHGYARVCYSSWPTCCYSLSTLSFPSSCSAAFEVADHPLEVGRESLTGPGHGRGELRACHPREGTCRTQDCNVRQANVGGLR